MGKRTQTVDRERLKKCYTHTKNQTERKVTEQRKIYWSA